MSIGRSDPSLPPSFAAAGLALPLMAGAVGSLLAAAGALAAHRLFGASLLAPLVPCTTALAAVLLAVGQTTRLRAAVAAAAAGEAPAPPGEPPAPPGEPDRPGRAARAAETLERFGRDGVAYLLAVGGALSFALSLAGLRGNVGSGPSGRAAALAGVALGLLAFTLMVASRGSGGIPPVRFPESLALARWLRAAQWTCALVAAGLFARALGIERLDASRWIAVGLLVGWAAVAGELALRGLRHVFRAPAPWAETEVPVYAVTLAAAFQGRHPLDGTLLAAEEHLGLSLRSTWTIGVVRRSAVPLVVATGLLTWALTALVAVGPAEEGIRLRFGRVATRSPLGPGLHAKLPWPLETVARYPVRRVQTLGLGYAGPPPASLLWGRPHAGEEYQLLLGDGRELVSVDGTVSYRIRDVVTFALGSQNPRAMLEALAYRLLLRETVATSLDSLLTADRDGFARRFAAALQQAADTGGLGLEILHVGFVSLHPPVGIARAYEEVVSAEIERQTRAGRGRVYRETALPAAAAEAAREVQAAEAEAAARLAEAEAGAAAFLAALDPARAAPELYRFRRRLEAVEEGLADRSLFVVDHRLRAGAGDLWIDLRPGSPRP
jgi:regulator of protease activity HflC (stomatin/prohibitin superfamily)